MAEIDDLIHVKIQNPIIITVIFNLFGSFYLDLSFAIMKYVSLNLCFCNTGIAGIDDLIQVNDPDPHYHNYQCMYVFICNLSYKIMK